MGKASVEELRGRVSAGDYAVDSGKVAGDILSKFALIGRVRRLLIGDEAEGAPSESLRRTTNAFLKDSAR